MVGSKAEQEVVSLFSRQTTAVYSINQIAKELDKSYPYVNQIVHQLLAQDVLQKTQVGRSYLCSLDLGSDKTIALLTLQYDELRKTKFNEKHKKLIQQLRNLRKEFTIYSIVFFDNKFHIILDHLHDKAAISQRIRSTKQLAFFTPKQFIEKVKLSPTQLDDCIVVYSCEGFAHLIEPIQDELMMRRLHEH